MQKKDKVLFILGSMFCATVITGNLIFQKFILLNMLWHTFELSVGVLLYPITFLLMDIISEFYGKHTANFVIRVSISISIIVMGLIFVADILPSTIWSPIDNSTFHKVFSVYGIGALASLIANFFAQTVDVAIFTALKKSTQGKHLWLRNNVSTIIAQFIDTVTVVGILCIFSIIQYEHFYLVASSSFAFKVIFALLDTPFCYLMHYILYKKFNLDSENIN